MARGRKFTVMIETLGGNPEKIDMNIKQLAWPLGRFRGGGNPKEPKNPSAELKIKRQMSDFMRQMWLETG
jgi:hypothetical protein